jgi:hypothetical protein
MLASFASDAARRGNRGEANAQFLQFLNHLVAL